MYLFVEKTYNVLTFQQMNKYIIFGTCYVKHTKNTGYFLFKDVPKSRFAVVASELARNKLMRPKI